MNKKFFIQTLLAVGLLLSPTANAETVSGVNIGSSMFRTKIFTLGEYSSLPYVIINFREDYPGCFIQDVSDFKATVDGVSIQAVPLDTDENGYARTVMFVLPGSKTIGQLSTLRFSYRVKYIDKNQETDEQLYTYPTDTYHNIRYQIADYSTFESIEKIQMSSQLPVSESIIYPFDNPPGEYDYLLGDYAIDFQNSFSKFLKEMNYTQQAFVINEAGETVQTCTINNSRTGIYDDPDVSFSLRINQAITTPGKYWIVFPTKGAFRYHVDSSNGGYYNCYHIENLKVGPYIVRENSSAELPAVAADVNWLNDKLVSSDMLPDTISGCLTNAEQLGAHANQLSSYDSYIVFGSDSTAVSKIVMSDGNRFNAPLPDSWYKGPGNYRLVIKSPNDIFESITPDGQLIRFPENEELTFDFSVADPQLPEALDLYMRSASAATYEIGEGESLALRLMHSDQALGMKIFVKWTGDEPMHSDAATDSDGFAEHLGDLEISSPGRLDYYTVRGASTSSVKTISFVAKPTAGVESPEIVSAIPAEEGLYDLRGIRVAANPPVGIYIRRLADGTTRKVIVR